MKVGAKYKICRRLGSGVYEKCQTQKYTLSEAKKAGAKGKRPRALSDYGRQLIEKQKVRFSYGLSEKQFSNYVEKASTKKGASATDTLYHMLETRLDNVVYRLGFAATRRGARQMVSHGHFTVDGKKVTIPSYQVKAGTVVAVREGSRSSALFADFAKKAALVTVPAWLKLVPEALSGEVKGVPKNDEQFLSLDTVLEFYSR